MIESRSKSGIHCSNCSNRKLCIPRHFNEEQIELFDQSITQTLSYKKNQNIYHQEKEASHVYAVYKGYCKEYWITKNGEEIVNCFYLPGDILGLETFTYAKHSYSALTLTDTIVCAIPKSIISHFGQSDLILKRLLKLLCYKYENDNFMTMTTNAKQRVANFLFNLLMRYQEREISVNLIYLPMSKIDISHAIGVAHETISRILHEFQGQKIIAIHSNKEIEVNDLKALRAIAKPPDHFGQYEDKII